MPQNTDLATLVKLRNDLVEYRRAVSDQVYQGNILAAAAHVIDFQNQIEIVDRAIEDEKRLAMKGV